MAPSVKFFIWLILYGWVKEFFLHSLNLRPETLFIFCKLNCEAIDFLLGSL